MVSVCNAILFLFFCVKNHLLFYSLDWHKSIEGEMIHQEGKEIMK